MNDKLLLPLFLFGGVLEIMAALSDSTPSAILGVFMMGFAIYERDR
jgi:hypothetical protein